MKSKIPTASEYLNILNCHFEKTFEPNGDKLYVENVVKNMMIHFAQLHVEAALQAAANNAKIAVYSKDNKILSDMYYTNFRNAGKREVIVSKDSILNAYPLDNIK